MLWRGNSEIRYGYGYGYGTGSGYFIIMPSCVYQWNGNIIGTLSSIKKHYLTAISTIISIRSTALIYFKIQIMRERYSSFGSTPEHCTVHPVRHPCSTLSLTSTTSIMTAEQGMADSQVGKSVGKVVTNIVEYCSSKFKVLTLAKEWKVGKAGKDLPDVTVSANS